MRREKRPFVVEVKRGQKRPATTADPDFVEVKQDTQRRAEEALFGAPSADSQSSEPAAPPRRILEAVAAEPEPIPEIEAPRRGRKPGSRNKDKSEAIVVSGEKRRRGRPPRNPESLVRKVAVTPELTSAALQTIAQFSQATPLSPVPGASMTSVQGFEPQPKRKRGRPRKIKPPKFDWAVWTDGDDAPEAREPVAAAPVAVVAAVAELPPLARAPRSAALRLRSGERWKRRLRIPGGGPARPRARGA